MPTRFNRGFYCRSYCLLNKFRAPLCPSSRAQEWLLPVVFRAVVFKLLVWCGAVGCVSGLQDAALLARFCGVCGVGDCALGHVFKSAEVEFAFAMSVVTCVFVYRITDTDHY